jgi:hypothetical protein
MFATPPVYLFDSFLFLQELLPHSILYSSWLDVYGGRVMKSFTPTWVVVGPFNITTFSDESLDDSGTSLAIKGLSVTEEPEATYKRPNVLRLVAAPPPEGKSSGLKAVASFISGTQTFSSFLCAFILSLLPRLLYRIMSSDLAIGFESSESQQAFGKLLAHAKTGCALTLSFSISSYLIDHPLCLLSFYHYPSNFEAFLPAATPPSGESS